MYRVLGPRGELRRRPAGVKSGLRRLGSVQVDEKDERGGTLQVYRQDIGSFLSTLALVC